MYPSVSTVKKPTDDWPTVSTNSKYKPKKVGRIGNLGDLITFEVSWDKVLTFRNMKTQRSGQWANHQVIGRKPVAEFLGPGLGILNLDIYLSAMHGVRPRHTMNLIDIAVENGTPLRLIIGGYSVGTYRWVITSVSESWNEMLNGGELMAANVSLTLSEYYEHGARGGKYE